jgi:hypothetical protein
MTILSIFKKFPKKDEKISKNKISKSDILLAKKDPEVSKMYIFNV